MQARSQIGNSGKPTGSEECTMNESDQQIITKLLNGWTLKTLMEPDILSDPDELPHVENLTLKAVIIKNSIFWGLTLHQHLSISSKDYFLATGRSPYMNTFLYSNFGDKSFFANIMEEISTRQVMLNLAPLSRYKSHNWVLVRDYKLIYETDGDCAPKDEVESAIRNNDELKCAFLSQDGFWHINNVHIPYFVLKTGKVYIQTEPFRLPIIFFTEDWMEYVQREKMGLLEKMDATGTRGGLRFESPVAHAQYIIDLDGYFSDMASQSDRRWIRTKKIRIFKRRMPADVEKAFY